MLFPVPRFLALAIICLQVFSVHAHPNINEKTIGFQILSDYQTLREPGEWLKNSCTRLEDHFPDHNISHSWIQLDNGGEGAILKYVGEKSEQFNSFVFKRFYEISPFTRMGEVKTKLTTIAMQVSIGRKVDHPNLLKCQECYISDKQHVTMQMDHLSGTCVTDVTFTRKAYNDSNLMEPFLAGISLQTLSALKHLHMNEVVHRDVKPDNLFFLESGKVVLLDYGLAYPFRYGVTEPLSFAGTMEFADPAFLRQSLSPPHPTVCDVWSFGVTMLVLAIGSMPFDYIGIGDRPNRGLFDFASDATRSLDKLRARNIYSEEFINFLDIALMRNTARRATVRQLLDHPFLQKYKGQTDEELYEFTRVAHRNLLAIQSDKSK